ncbi:MAG: CehA/McbA family metallohydrolase [Verrucomicrobiota bacterium]|nr:CehA/McbA family metallohydrolase [Verrucomicrobiota bacterium]
MKNHRALNTLSGIVVMTFLQTTPLHGASLTGKIVDEQSGAYLAARVYVENAKGEWFFVESAEAGGSAVHYDKTNWLRNKSFEKHTTVSAHPFRAELPSGDYTITAKRGKEYFSETKSVSLGQAGAKFEVRLRRWIDMTKRGWYSGETHIHRTLEELPNIIQAEDLNVAMPLTYWVTKSDLPPTSGNRNIGGEIPDRLITADPTHVIWPRNTEYEIFSVGPKQHTLGALFFLNHKSVFKEGVPPWGPLARRARDEGTIFDMDKLDWPFSMTLPHSTGARLYELANNHMWRTQFAFTKWNSPTPGFLQPPAGNSTGNEEEWLNYTLGQYYTLLNAGFDLVPTAGTANGVHPVPAGFSRVYVHLPDGFNYKAWLDGLKHGRSFVTTGPMLFAKVNEQQPGETLSLGPNGSEVIVTGEVISESPDTFMEIVFNGQPVLKVRSRPKTTPSGACRMAFSNTLSIKSSGWIAVRCYEERPGGRLRFAHTGQWKINVPGKPSLPSPEEKEYLLKRVQTEIDRSADIVSAEALAEYNAARAYYQNLTTSTPPTPEARTPKHDNDLKRWLENMITHHQYTPHEVRAATGLPLVKVHQKIKDWNIDGTRLAKRTANAPLKVLPYPGGRHPRIGFLDGALVPQRETKVSIFPPWDPHSYAVVDVPEAIWSNLGLTYLAHTHIPTIWDKQSKILQQLEWSHNPDGTLSLIRPLPNGILFGSRVAPGHEVVRMSIWIRNGSPETLTGLRAQVCVMLKGLSGFNQRIHANKVIDDNWAACRDADAKRWIITGWEPIHRPWENPPVPCMHADPAFPDCPPGKTVEANGILTFYEGSDIKNQIRKLSATHFRGK